MLSAITFLQSAKFRSLSMNYRNSAGIGFIALFGICIQNGVILIQVFHKNLEKQGRHQPVSSLGNSIREGLQTRVRPVIMTAFMAALGLLTAALSTDIGSKTARPLAIVVIGGLVTATVLTLLVFPILYGLVNQRKYS